MITRELLKSAHSTSLLSDVVDFLDSQRRPVKETDRIAGPYPYYGANGLQGWIDGFLFDEPLLLLAEDGGHFDDPDRGVAYRIEGKSWVNNHAHVLRPKPFMDIRFLCRVLENYDLRPFITGSTRAKLTKKDAERIVIPVPPLDEQRRIAAILDQADDLRRKRREALARANSLIDALLIDVVGDPLRNPKDWPIERLGNVCVSISDGPHVSPSYVEAGIPFLSTRNVRKNEVVWDDLKFISQVDADLQWKKVKPARGDVLYTKGGTTGIACAVDFETEFAVWVHVAVLKLRPKVVDPIWLQCMLNSSFCYAQSQSLTKGIVNRDLGLRRMVDIQFPLPPLSLQRAFAARVAEIDKLKAHHRAHLARLDALFASLQHRAFRGDLSVPPFSRAREKVASRSEVG